MEEQSLKVVAKFTYLSSTLSKSIIMDDEVNTRLAKTSAAFGQLIRNVWNWRSISEATKIKVYRAVVLTTLLYGCEMWTTYQQHIKKLNHFHTTSRGKILGITGQKHIPQYWSFNSGFSSQHLNHLDAITAWKITASHRNCSMGNYLRASTPKEVRKGAWKMHLMSPWNFSVLPLITWCRTETSDVELSNLEWKSVKPEETQQLSCTGNLEKALPHQILVLSFLVLTARDSSMHRLISLAIRALTGAFFNHKVDQMILTNYDGQRRRNIYICIYIYIYIYI